MDALEPGLGVDFASRLRTQRKRLGLSQQQLAAKLGVRKPTVSRWETQGQLPQTRLREGLASALGIDSREIYRWMGLSPPAVTSNVIRIHDRPAPYEVDAEAAQRFTTAVLAGIEYGHATSESWLKATRATAQMIGVRWEP